MKFNKFWWWVTLISLAGLCGYYSGEAVRWLGELAESLPK